MSSAISILFKGLVVVWLLVFFWTQLWNLAYWLWVFSWFLGVWFYLPTYFGASCDLALTLSTIFSSVFLVVICFKIYYMIKGE